MGIPPPTPSKWSTMSAMSSPGLSQSPNQRRSLQRSWVCKARCSSYGPKNPTTISTMGRTWLNYASKFPIKHGLNMLTHVEAWRLLFGLGISWDWCGSTSIFPGQFFSSHPVFPCSQPASISWPQQIGRLIRPVLDASSCQHPAAVMGKPWKAVSLNLLMLWWNMKHRTCLK